MSDQEKAIFALLFLAAIGAMFAIAWLVTYLPMLRRKRLSRWAASRGLNFSWLEDRSFNNKFPLLMPLQQQEGYAFNIASGAVDGVPVWTFDYQYRPGNNLNDARKHFFSGVIVQTWVDAPGLSVREENFIDRFSDFIGMNDIDFESKEFSDRFFVECESKKAAYKIIDTAVMEHMLTARGYFYYFNESYVLVTRKAFLGLLNADQLDAALNHAVELARRMPPGPKNESSV